MKRWPLVMVCVCCAAMFTLAGCGKPNPTSPEPAAEGQPGGPGDPAAPPPLPAESEKKEEPEQPQVPETPKAAENPGPNANP